MGITCSLSQMTDEALVSLFRQGEQGAFSELLHRYAPAIRQKAATFRSSFYDADDMMQEGAVGLLNAARAYDTESEVSFKTFAAVCIGRKLITAYNYTVNQKNRPLKNYISLGTGTEDYVGDAHFLSESGKNPEELVVSAEAVRQMEQRIAVILSDKEQKVLMMYLSGLSYNEIANTLSLTSKTVDNALQRVRKKLRESCL